MADVITRFKLETTQYDSKLRDASKTLSEFARQVSFAGKDFDKFTKGNVEAARAFGNISTSATNAKDKVKELVGAYNDMARSYNMLSKEQQQSDWAKAMAQSMQTLKGRITEAKKEMQELQNVTKNAGSGGGLFSGDKLSGMLQVFGGNLMTKATGMAVGTITNFANELQDCVKQGIELAKQGEGIRIAFERLGRGDILQGLREATHGTVTDLELMKAAVKFNDFRLPVEELGTMLAFAQQKAKDTGQSVDYMVDSIVTGLGRKSLMILDNLGLSAAEIKEKMKDTGDMTKAVGEIIREQMAKAGDYVETAADRAAQANVSLQNKMEELGRKFAPVEEASNQLWTSMKIAILDIIGGPLARLLNDLTDAGKLRNMMNDMAGGDSNTETDKQIGFLQKTSARNRRKRYDKQIAIYEAEESKEWRKVSSLKAQREAFRKEVMRRGVREEDQDTYNDYDKQIAEATRKAMSWQIFRINYQHGAQAILDSNKGGNSPFDNEIQLLDTLKKKLKELETQRKKAIKAGDSDLAKNLTQQINQIKKQIKVLDPDTLKPTGNTHKTTPQEKAAEMVATAERTYAESLQKSAIRMEVGLDSTLEGKKKELAAQERLFDAYNDAYATYKDPKYKEAAAEAADKIILLAGEVKSATEAQKATEKAARELEATQKKVSDALAQSAEAYRNNDLKGYIAAQSKVGGDATVGFSADNFTATTGNIDAFIQNLKQRISESDAGSELYNNLTKQLADANTLGNLIEVAVKNGIDISQFDPQEFWKKIFGENPGDYIDDKMWQDIVNKMNQSRKKGTKAISLDTQTGNVSQKDSMQQLTAMNTMVNSMNSIASGVQSLGIKIPQGISDTISVLQTIMGIVSAIQAISTVKFFSGGGVVHAAGGYMVPGTSYSGDRIPAMLNAGEVVLNRAQAGVIAESLETRENNMGTPQARISGEQIYLTLGAYLKRSGRGEILTSR